MARKHGFFRPHVLGLSAISSSTLKEGVGDQAPAWRDRGIVAARMADPVQNGEQANGSSYTSLWEQNRFIAAIDASDISLVYHNIRRGADGYVNQQIKASVLKGSGTDLSPWQGVSLGSTYYIATWDGGSDSGMRSPAIAPGELLETNETALSVVEGGLIIVRNDVDYASAPTNWNATALAKFVGDETIEVNGSTERISPGNTSPSNDWAGGHYSYDLNPLAHLVPSLILGTTTTRRARLKLLGDSILGGSGDSDQGSVNFPGPIQRLITDDYPWSMWQQDGATLNDVVNTPATLARFLATIDLGGFTHVIVQSVTNDVQGGRTSAQYMADLATLKAAMEALPLKPRLIPCTPPPRTNASNNATTTGISERRAIDAAIRAGDGVGYGFIDFATAWAGGDPSTGTGFWDTTGGKGSTDGVHPNKTTSQAIATANASALSTLLSVDHYV